MQKQGLYANPFALMLNPAEVFQAMERSDRLERLQRRVCRPLDRPLIPRIQDANLAAYDAQIDAPTVVIHGRADKLMRPAGGRAIADAIPGARLVLFDGMGHNLPEPLWDDIISELDATFSQFAGALKADG